LHRRRDPDNPQVERGKTARSRDSNGIRAVVAAAGRFDAALRPAGVDERSDTFPSPREELHMQFASSHSADPVEELRLRRWARENYVAVEFRDQNWHAVVLDEMRRKDEEQAAVASYAEVARRIVPLVTDQGRGLRGPHIDVVRSNVLVRVPSVE